MRIFLWCIAAVAVFAAPASAQNIRTGFCNGWHGVCLRTCPGGDCSGVCRQRLATCRTTGCFHFNVPRPRCDSDAEDVALWRSPRR